MTLPPLSLGGSGMGDKSPGFLTVTSKGRLVGGELIPVSTLRSVGMGDSPESNAGSGVGTPGGSVDPNGREDHSELLDGKKNHRSRYGGALTPPSH